MATMRVRKSQKRPRAARGGVLRIPFLPLGGINFRLDCVVSHFVRDKYGMITTSTGKISTQSKCPRVVL